MRAFTKTLKIPFKVLRSKGHLSVVYIDDSFLLGETYNSCQKNIDDTISLLISLGFTIHPHKSVITPTQQLIFLGFMLDSKNMTISLTSVRANKLLELCNSLLKFSDVTIRYLARVIGTMVSCFPATSYGQLHYRCLENLKIVALKQNRGNFNARVKISSKDCINEINWWIDQKNKFSRPIRLPSIDLVLYSDASLEGWGGSTGSCKGIGGRWSYKELPNHINALELAAAFLTLKAFFVENRYKHIHLKLDNTTAVAYVNKMGGSHSPACNGIAIEIWQWALNKGVWLSASHVPGVDNVIADNKSRRFNDNIEWSLSSDAFVKTCHHFGKPSIDLFASRLNAKCKDYYSWKPDPSAIAIDAFVQNWSNLKFFAFPPFKLIGRVLAKMQKDQASGIVVVPYWSTQPWFPQIVRMCIRPPILFSPSPRLLELVGTAQVHPLHRQLSLLVAHLSGKHSETLIYQMPRFISYRHHGDQGLRNNTMVPSEDGLCIVLGETSIPIVPM